MTHIPPVRKTKLSAWRWGTSCGPARFSHGTLAGLAQASFEKEAWPVPAISAKRGFPLKRPSPEAVWVLTAGAARPPREFGGLRFGNLGSFGFVDQQLEVLRSNETSEGKDEGKRGCLP